MANREFFHRYYQLFDKDDDDIMDYGRLASGQPGVRKYIRPLDRMEYPEPNPDQLSDPMNFETSRLMDKYRRAIDACRLKSIADRDPVILPRPLYEMQMNQLNNEELHYKLDENERLNRDNSRKEIRYKVGRDDELSVSIIEKDLMAHADQNQPAGHRSKTRDAQKKDHIFELIDENIEKQRKRTRDILSGKRPTQAAPTYDANISLENITRRATPLGQAAGQYRRLLRDGMQVKNIFKYQGAVTEDDEKASRMKLKRNVQGVTSKSVIDENVHLNRNKPQQLANKQNHQYLRMVHDRPISGIKRDNYTRNVEKAQSFIDDTHEYRRMKRPSPDFEVYERGGIEQKSSKIATKIAAGIRTVRDSNNDPQKHHHQQQSFEARPQNPYLYPTEKLPTEVFEYNPHKPMRSLLEVKLSQRQSSANRSPSTPLPDHQNPYTVTFSPKKDHYDHQVIQPSSNSHTDDTNNRYLLWPIDNRHPMKPWPSMADGRPVDRQYVKPNEVYPGQAGMHGTTRPRDSIATAAIDAGVVAAMVDRGVSHARGYDGVCGVVAICRSLKDSMKQRGYLEDERVAAHAADKVIENSKLLDHLTQAYATEARVIEAAYALKKRLISAQHNPVILF